VRFNFRVWIEGFFIKIIRFRLEFDFSFLGLFLEFS
jgi:hypothetical protein